LLVVAPNEQTISRSLQRIAGRTAQECNSRKNRKNSFWEDRYHATAADTDKHLAKCMIYIDLNMAREEVVPHPFEYKICNYNKIQIRLNDIPLVNKKCCGLFFIQNENKFRDVYSRWIIAELETKPLIRNQDWNESIAVGSKSFTTKTKQ